MRIKIRRIDRTLALPVYKTAGSVAFDLTARVETVVAPGEIARIPLNTIVETPSGYMLMLVPRSSLPAKKLGLVCPHGVGIIDQDYCGPEDELKLQVQNIGSQPVVITRGEAIAQAILVKMEKAEFEEVNEIKDESRGGFGSTDEF